MTLADNRIRKLVILGDGMAAWLSANVLAHVLAAQQVHICVAESGGEIDVDTFGPCVSTLPSIDLMHKLLGIDESTFMRRTNATFKLGTKLTGWVKQAESYFEPFGETGVNFEGIPFHHYWLALGGKEQAALSDYALSAVAANLGKFSHPLADTTSVLSTMAYGYHFDAALYTQMLRERATKHGIERLKGELTTVTHSDNGFVESLVLECDLRVPGDFFIDCSGPQGLLIAQALETGFEDWSPLLPCDRAISVSSRSADPLMPYTSATARAAGWQWRIPLQHSTDNGYVYSSRHVSDQDAAATLLANLDGSVRGEPRHQSFRSGRSAKFWNKNVVAIGGAASGLEPLASTGLHLVQRSLLRLIELFPDKSCAAGEATEYNRLMSSECERMRDFLLLHYALNGRDSAFWKDCRAMGLPPLLQRKIEHFRNRGRVVDYDEETFKPPSWAAVFLGQDVRPRCRDPLLDTVPPQQIATMLLRMKTAIRQAAEAMPTQRTYLAKIGAAAPVTID
ncbi:MAG: tryptophan 7-halogenase [Rhizomicrobium sp.]|nr:tryptophan 7-halogenase [Rhizomicrobium sp.]